MFAITPSTATSMIDKANTALGVVMPKSVTVALDRGRQVAAAVVRPPTQEQIIAAFSEAILAGRDPAADPEVQRLLAAAALGARDLSRQIAAATDASVQAAIIESCDEILAGWVKASAGPIKVLTEAHRDLDGIALTETATILTRGGRAAETWAEAQAADRTLDAVLGGWTALAGVTRFASPARGRTVLRIAEADLAQLRDLDDKARPWDLLSAGVELGLADRSTFAARNRALDAEVQAERAADEQQNLRYNGKLLV